MAKSKLHAIEGSGLNLCCVLSVRYPPALRPILNWLIILTLAFQGIIPVGYMPGTAGNGSSSITICGSAGLKYVIDASTGKKTPKPQNAPAHHAEDSCPFSLHSVFAYDGFAPPAQALIFSLLISLAMLTAFTLRPPARSGNASSRAPPLFS